VQGSFGRIEVANLKQGARILAANGEVAVSDVTGTAYVKTSFGQVRAERVSGGLRVENANAAVRVSAIKGGAEVRTSFGPVTLEDVAGTVDVRNQNGAVELALAATKPCSVTVVTSFAPIRVSVPDGLGLSLTSSTSFGSIRSDLPVTATGTFGKESLTGTVAGGGCPVSLTNQNGDIELRRATPR